MDCQVNGLTNTSQVLIYISVGKTQNLDSKRFQIFCSLRICGDTLWIIMLGAVQFQHQKCLCAVEIHNIRTEHTLPAKLDRIPAQILIPKDVFFFGCVFA